MGLLDQLLTLPLAPLRGATWLAGRLSEEAIRQTYDPGAIQQQLLEAEMAHDLGEITDDEWTELEDELLARLEISRQARLSQ